MGINWDSLDRWNIILGILGGIALVFSSIRWLVRHARSSKLAQLIAWSVIGEENEKTLVSTFRGLLRLLFAGLVWAFIGAVIGGVILLVTTMIAVGFGGKVSGTTTAVYQYALLGALAGATFRSMIWPIVAVVFSRQQQNAEDYVERRKEFENKKRQIQNRINRTRGNG
jgi:hypothetical protein